MEITLEQKIAISKEVRRVSPREIIDYYGVDNKLICVKALKDARGIGLKDAKIQIDMCIEHNDLDGKKKFREKSLSLNDIKEILSDSAWDSYKDKFLNKLI